MDLFKGLDLPEEVTKTLSERFESEISAVKEGVRNDSEFIESIRSAEAGKFYGSMESVLKRTFDYSDVEIPSDVSGKKKMEAMLKLGVSKFEKSKDTTNQELQDKYLALNEQFQSYKDDEVPKLLSDKDHQYQAKFIQDNLLKDSLEFETVCKAEVRPSLVDAYLSSNALKKVWKSEKGDYEIVNAKDNLKPTIDGKPLSKKDIIRAALDEAGVLTKSNGNPSPGDGRRKVTKDHSNHAARMTEGMHMG